MTRCIGVEHPNIEECILSVASPEVLSYDIRLTGSLVANCG